MRKAPRNASILRDPALMPMLLAAIAASLVARHFLPLIPKLTTVWRGYDTLLVRKGSAAQGRLSLLSPGLGAGRPAVSRFTASVSFNDFEGMTSCSVEELAARLDAKDPRFDPFLMGIGSYFSSADPAGQWEIAYIPSYRNPGALFARLVFLLGLPFSSWRLLEFDPAQVGIMTASALAFSLLLSFSLGRRSRGLHALLFLHAAVWLPAVVESGTAGLCLFFLLSVPWLHLLKESGLYARETILHVRDRRWKDSALGELIERLFEFLFPSVLLLILSGVAHGASPMIPLSMLSPFMSSLLILLVPFPLAAMRKAGRRKRTPFEPVAIVRRESKPLAFRYQLLALAAAATVLLTVLSMLRGAALPAPAAIPAARGLSWDYIEERLARPRSGPPDLSDAVAHAAYQEGLSFGRSYRLPARDERVRITEYIWNADSRSIIAIQRTVKAFDSAWLAGVALRMRPGSVERMLLDQGAPPSVSIRGPALLALRELPFPIVCLLALAAVLLAGSRFGPLISNKLWRFNRHA
jgi:hypothetical protein